MSYSIKAPVHNKGGLVESASKVHTTILSIDDGTVGISADDATLQFVSGDLVLENNIVDKNIVAKLGDNAGSAFQVQDSDGTVQFQIGSNGIVSMSTKTITGTGTGTTIPTFTANTRYVFIDLSSNDNTVSPYTITSTLSEGTIAGQTTTILVVNDKGNRSNTTQVCPFDLIITSFINPGDGVDSNQTHSFSNAGMSITLVWTGDNWLDISAGTV